MCRVIHRQIQKWQNLASGADGLRWILLFFYYCKILVIPSVHQYFFYFFAKFQDEKIMQKESDGVNYADKLVMHSIRFSKYNYLNTRVPWRTIGHRGEGALLNGIKLFIFQMNSVIFSKYSCMPLDIFQIKLITVNFDFGM